MQADRDWDHLHPEFAGRLIKVLEDLRGQGLPFAMFEGFRTRQRQAALYAQGRTVSGPVVTNARPGESFHQYGLAADVVWFGGERFSWSPLDPKAWDKLHGAAAKVGLRWLPWEKPHLEWAPQEIPDLQRTWRTICAGNFADTKYAAWLKANPPVLDLAPKPENAAPILHRMPVEEGRRLKEANPASSEADRLNDAELARIRGADNG